MKLSSVFTGMCLSVAFTLPYTAGIAQSAFSQLDINSISARINSVGPLWYDPTGFPGFEAPQGTGLHTLFATGLWVGGLDMNQNLHFAGELYRQGGPDYYSGPISDPVYYADNQQAYNRVWKITRQAIEDHLDNWMQPGYQTPAALLDWPAHGDPARGENYYLAPFFDMDQNGIYEPTKGDIPDIKGDMAIYSIFNDVGGLHLSSGGQAVGIEVHQMAYAYDCPDDPELPNTVFVNYKIINGTTTNYPTVYFGLFTDGDIGDGSDDYIGSDVERGAFYFYNGDAIDGPGNLVYGGDPPVQAVVFLAGPKDYIDGMDNVKDVAIPSTSSAFGMNDGIVDNERSGMSHFMYFNNTTSPLGNPSAAVDYFNLMSGYWKDGSQLSFGGNGHLGSINSVFAYPGASDPLGFGTFGVPQGQWSEIDGANANGDRRGVGTFGPVSFAPGEAVELDFAFVYSRVSNQASPWDAITRMEDAVYHVKTKFNQGNLSCRGPVGLATEKPLPTTLQVFPNPTQNYLTVSISSFQVPVPYLLRDVTGRIVMQGRLTNPNESLDLSSLDRGVYHLQVEGLSAPAVPVILN